MVIVTKDTIYAATNARLRVPVDLKARTVSYTG